MGACRETFDMLWENPDPVIDVRRKPGFSCSHMPNALLSDSLVDSIAVLAYQCSSDGDKDIHLELTTATKKS